MAWLGKVSLGNFSDLAGTVAKISESVKNIEKNFDSALGLEDKPDSAQPTTSGIWPSASDRKALFDPVMAFMGHRGDDSATEDANSPEQPSTGEEHGEVPTRSLESMVNTTTTLEENESNHKDGDADVTSNELGEADKEDDESELNFSHAEITLPSSENVQTTGSIVEEASEELGIIDESDAGQLETTSSHGVDDTDSSNPHVTDDKRDVSDSPGSHDKLETEGGQGVEEDLPDPLPVHDDTLPDRQVNIDRESSGAVQVDVLNHESSGEVSDENISDSTVSVPEPAISSDSVPHDIVESSEPLVVGSRGKDTETIDKEHTGNSLDPTVLVAELEKVRKEMKFMEAALQGAARQSQAKADEIAKFMNENEELKSLIEDLKKKSKEAEIDVLRDEYHQRVSALERKVYALTKERDTLRREQSRKSDAAALLKEKDEIISQVMAEGEELSKKQAAQELTIRKLRAQIREFEEEKQRLNSRLQVEETKVESIKKDKAATEKLLQETIERNQAELAAQKEFYVNALNSAKEAEALAEARANNEARDELESRLREAGERESMLVQTLEELRQTLSRTEQQAVFREDMLRRDFEDLQKRYQASELRYNELITQVPESTRPLLREIEAMQEISARRQEAWAGVERALNSRLQEAEAKAAAAEERERAMNERVSQTLSRITVLETQNTCLRTEQKQLSRSLEKERQRASENRQEYLAATEEAATQEGRAKQLDDEIKELRSRVKHELQEEVVRREFLEKELEKERAARLQLESAPRQTTAAGISPYTENGRAPLRSLSSSGSLNSMEESVFLQASLDSSESYFSERRIPGETTMSPYFLKSMTPSAFEAALRQKDGELASYISRLASLESIRDSLAEELVNMTAQCEKLRTEAVMVPGLRAELEALRRRHSSALELMGERDEELEELRADIMDLKEMYREQVDLLVNRLQMLNSSVAAA